jgi:hypothetical protein
MNTLEQGPVVGPVAAALVERAYDLVRHQARHRAPRRQPTEAGRPGVPWMTWRDIFLRRFGPGLLSGITARDWVRVLADNGFAVTPDRLPKAAAITW